MTNSFRGAYHALGLFACCLSALALASCAGAETTSGTGGTNGTGGSDSSGGSTGQGGSSGATGTGGATATGGASAKGGAGGGAAGKSGAAGASGTGGAAGGSASCAPGTMPTGGKTITAAGQGTADGSYTYNFYTNGQGTASMVVYGVAAEFGATWSNPGDFLARVGLGFNETKTPTQLGTVTATFAETKSGTAGYNYIGVYGWSVNPLVEYYIVEDWFGSRPVPGTKAGTITVDGAMYDVYTHTQMNQPTITGQNATFPQYFSVRQTAHSCGTITVSDHFSQWASKFNLTLGMMEEARLVVEVGGGGSGTITFTTATMTNN